MLDANCTMFVDDLASYYEMTAEQAWVMLFNLDLLEKDADRCAQTGCKAETILSGAKPTQKALTNNYIALDAVGRLVLTGEGVRHINDAISENMRNGRVGPSATQEVQDAFIAVEEEHVREYGLSYLLLPYKAVSKRRARGHNTLCIADHYGVPFGVIAFVCWSDFPLLIDPRKAAA